VACKDKTAKSVYHCMLHARSHISHAHISTCPAETFTTFKNQLKTHLFHKHLT